jgi:hypothetical protein
MEAVLPPKDGRLLPGYATSHKAQMVFFIFSPTLQLAYKKNLKLVYLCIENFARKPEGERLLGSTGR